ncbi:MAG: hypothetical protein AUH99_01560 [Candidatus Rokubacteria bacterium 13_2_20CM_2_70_11]|nr:MAG: hypothetical protein AUH99_01560 [Candidatus Rokubacteria bacterium 13_2_20CM_2_70_11]
MANSFHDDFGTARRAQLWGRDRRHRGLRAPHLLVGGAWFNFVLARIPDTPTTLRVGERPPDFTLPDAAGRPVSLAGYRGKKPVVLVFYRGYW